MWPKRDPPPLDRETVDGIIEFIMRIDANVQALADELLEEDEDEETGS